ncbi:MAG: MBL fold metallo-hydrolase [Clostridiales bacterium]|nr:MBL fold metallo-hydrolase [Clostridiales bacterium]
MKIISLIDNTSVNKKLETSHAISFYAEVFDKKIIFDTGDSSAVISNAKKLGVPVKGLTDIIISHNHLAHTGGAEAFLKQSPKARLYMKANCVDDFYIKTTLVKKNISLPKGFFKKFAKRMILFNNFTEISDRIYLCSNEKNDEEVLNLDKSYLRKSNDEFVPDDFNHECFAVIFPKERKQDGLVIITGCAHQGISNFVNTVKYRWYDIPILGVIGGFHLMKNTPSTLNCSEKHVKLLAEKLNSSAVKRFYTCHCTGTRAFDILADTLQSKITYFSCGEEIRF